MSQVPDWVVAMTEDVIGGPPVVVGRRYIHHEDGLIEITGGQYWGEYGISNFWYWTVIATGEQHHGYGSRWQEVE